MNPEVKAKWIEALRSGKYKQGEEVLHYKTPEGDHKYCCLGVLCDIAVEEDVISPGVETREYQGEFAYGSEGDRATLPVEVMKWSGLTHFNPIVDGVRLAEYNDGNNYISEPPVRKHNFREIADLIERYL